MIQRMRAHFTCCMDEMLAFLQRKCYTKQYLPTALIIVPCDGMVQSAESRQKKAYDRKAKDHHFQIGDRVMPGTVTSQSWKLARPYCGPCRVLNVTPINIEARLADDVDVDSMFVAIDRVRLCPDSLPNDVDRKYKA